MARNGCRSSDHTLSTAPAGSSLYCTASATGPWSRGAGTMAVLRNPFTLTAASIEAGVVTPVRTWQTS